jgi:hypothetical protein
MNVATNDNKNIDNIFCGLSIPKDALYFCGIDKIRFIKDDENINNDADKANMYSYDDNIVLFCDIPKNCVICPK